MLTSGLLWSVRGLGHTPSPSFTGRRELASDRATALRADLVGSRNAADGGVAAGQPRRRQTLNLFSVVTIGSISVPISRTRAATACRHHGRKGVRRQLQRVSKVVLTMAPISQTSLTSGETISDVGASRDGRGGLTATELICGSCAHPSSTGKFCSECGARLTQATRSAEYKQVTVLFADVVRSMDLAAVLDMERLREVITELVERSAAVLRRYGGTVEYNGDGVMALFGAPVALEDHAFRGCLAALAIHEEVHLLAAEVARRDGVALQLRVGLDSGQVIA